MACYHPLDAWQLENGQVVFAELGLVRRQLQLPCGRCIGCRQVRQRAWAVRCMHEASMHEFSSFVTLTYAGPEFDRASLNYRHFQLFMKRLRRQSDVPVRFFMSGEYGGLNLRPHFHALLFGVGFDDLVKLRRSGSNWLYSSRTLQALWQYGFASVGEVTPQSAAYVAKYSLKVANGLTAAERYSRVDVSTGEIYRVAPEFGHMSLRPGLGQTWFRKFWRDVYAARDGVIVEGRKQKAPRYYDDLLEKVSPQLRSEREVDRYFNSLEFAADQTPDRLLDRERVAMARVKFNKRSSI